MAVQLDGHDGYWVRVSVGNSFNAIGAKEVTEGEYLRAVDDMRQIVERHEQEARMAREVAAEELAAKRAQVETELAALGLSDMTVKTILDQIQRG